MKALRKYWNRLRITDEDAERAARSFWLQMACTRFPDVKNAAELCRIAEQFQAWHFDGAVERIEIAVMPARIRAAE